MPDPINGTNTLPPELPQLDASDPQIKSAAQPVQLNRLEKAKTDERAFAHGNPFSSGSVSEYLEGIPSPGAAELETHGYVDMNGAQLKATIERDADGSFDVKLQGGVQAGLGLGIGAFSGGTGGGTFEFRTAEAAADFLTSVAATQAPLVGELSKQRVSHYVQESLHEVSGSFAMGASAYLPMPCIAAGLEAKNESTLSYDSNRNTVVIDQAVSGKALGRMGAVLFSGGLEGEVIGRVRTEVHVSPADIDRLRAGTISVRDLLSRTDVRSELVLEANGRGEFTTPFAVGQSKSELIKAEAHVDLAGLGDLQKIIDDPERARAYVRGSVKRYHALEVAGTEVQMLVVDLKLQAARYAITETPLFSQDEPRALQRELDGKRLTNAFPK